MYELETRSQYLPSLSHWAKIISIFHENFVFGPGLGFENSIASTIKKNPP